MLLLSEASNIQRASWGQGQISFIGQGGAGKTSMVRVFMGESISGTASTVGIEQHFVSDSKSMAAGNKGWKTDDVNVKRLERQIARAIVEKRTKEIVPAGGSPSIHVVTPSKQSTGVSTINLLNQPMLVVDKSKDVAATISMEYTAHPVADVDEHELMRNLGNRNLGDVRITVLDMGGQKLFISINILFLKLNMIFILAFNMEWFQLSASEEVRNKALSYLRFWMNAVIVHTFDSASKTTAPIVFVGTHKDKVPNIVDHEAITTMLYTLISECPVQPLVVKNKHGENSRGAEVLPFFPVDNLVQGLEDATTKHLMEELVKFLSTVPYVTQLKPVTWLKFCDTIRERRQQMQYMSFVDIVALANSHGIPSQDVEALLKFLHEMSVLMWFTEDGLRDVVILDPLEFFVPAITSIIRKHDPTSGDDTTVHGSELHDRCSRSLPSEWRKFLRSGILDAKLLSMLLEPWAQHETTITLLMIKFGLLVSILSGDSDTDSRFVVPSLLPASPLFAPNLKNFKICNSCMLVFTLKGAFTKTSFVSKDDLAYETFLPDGLFSRLLGKLIGWSQETSGSSSIEAMDLSIGAASLWFGNQSFRIVEFSELKYLLLEIEGLNPCAVLKAVIELAKITVNECMPNLECNCLIPYEDVFIPLSAIFANTASNQPLRLSGGRVLEVSVMVSLFHNYLASKLGGALFDLFMSYRQNACDSPFTGKLFDGMSTFSLGQDQRAVKVFLDRERLEAGNDFQEQFGDSLLASSVIVPIVSVNALERMLTHNPADEDNVLIEWILSNEAHRGKHGRVEYVFPIMIGPENPITRKVSNFFATGIIEKLPSIIPTASINRAVAILRARNIDPHDSLFSKTVREIVEELLKHLGFDLSDIENPSRYCLESSRRIFAVINQTKGFRELVFEDPKSVEMMSLALEKIRLLEEEFAGIDPRVKHSREEMAQRSLIESQPEYIEYHQCLERCINEGFMVSTVFASETFSTQGPSACNYLDILSSLTSSLPFASIVFSVTSYASHSISDAQKRAEFRNISYLNPSGSSVEANAFSDSLATHLTIAFQEDLLSGVFHRDEMRVGRIKESFAIATKFVSEKTGRGLFGDQSDHSAPTVLALDHAHIVMRYIMNLTEEQAKGYSSRTSSLFGLLLDEVRRDYPVPTTAGLAVQPPSPPPSSMSTPPSPVVPSAWTADATVKSGFLLMKSRSYMLYAGWNSYIFVLKGDKTMSYFSPDNRAVAKGSFSVKNALIRSIAIQGREHTFEVNTEDRESVLLQAYDAAELASWIETLTAIAK